MQHADRKCTFNCLRGRCSPRHCHPHLRNNWYTKRKIVLYNFMKQSFHMKFNEQDMDQFHKFHLSIKTILFVKRYVTISVHKQLCNVKWRSERMKKRKRNYQNIWAASWENQQCGFRTGPTQTDLYKHRKELEA